MHGYGLGNGELQLGCHMVRERGDDQFFRDVYRTRRGRYGDRDRYVGPGHQQDRQHHADRHDAATDHHFGFGLL
jgi:hypothetical protein